MTKEQETEMWKKKDWLQARESASKATSVIFEGKAVNSEDFIAYAEKIIAWIWQGQEPVTVAVAKVPVKTAPKPSKTAELPLPTPQQKIVLDKICDALAATNTHLTRCDEIYEKVLDWTEKVTAGHTRVYPSKLESVDKFITYFEEIK